jgi:hypothetical protein
LDRLNDFLKDTELLDTFSEAKSEAQLNEPTIFNKDLIGFEDSSFVWSLGAMDGSLTPSRRPYKLRIKDSLFFKPDCVNLIVGPT